jgi:hypothetical protein
MQMLDRFDPVNAVLVSLIITILVVFAVLVIVKPPSPEPQYISDISEVRQFINDCPGSTNIKTLWSSDIAETRKPIAWEVVCHK